MWTAASLTPAATCMTVRWKQKWSWTASAGILVVALDTKALRINLLLVLIGIVLCRLRRITESFRSSARRYAMRRRAPFHGMPVAVLSTSPGVGQQIVFCTAMSLLAFRIA